MVELEDWWVSVWDKLVEIVQKVSGFDAEHVFYGEKQPVDTFPSAYVCPGETTAEPATFRETHFNPSFEIGVVVENAITKEGMTEAYKLCLRIARTLEQNRSLDELCENLECPRIIPYWRDYGRGTEQHWCGVVVQIQRKR